MSDLRARCTPFFLGFAALVGGLSLSVVCVSAQEPTALQLSLASTSDFFTNLDGGEEQGSAVSHLGELSLTLDSQAAWGAPGGTLFLLAARADGSAPGELAGTVHAVSNLAADDDWYLLEAWYEQRFNAGRSAVLAGVYAVDAEFDARVAAEVFVNGAFGTGLDLSESGAAGPGIFPQTGLGLRVRHALSPFLTVRAAVVDGRPSVDGVRQQLTLDRAEGGLLITELDYQPATDLPVRYVVGGWRYSQAQPRLHRAHSRDDAQGAYAFWEADLLGRTGVPGPRLSAFARLGAAAEATAPVRLHYSAGLSLHEPLPGRTADTAGIALSHAEITAGAGAGSGTAAETMLELTYAAQVAPWLRVQPTLQYALDPVAAAGCDALLVGLRLGISF